MESNNHFNPQHLTAVTDELIRSAETLGQRAVEQIKLLEAERERIGEEIKRLKMMARSVGAEVPSATPLATRTRRRGSSNYGRRPTAMDKRVVAIIKQLAEDGITEFDTNTVRESLGLGHAETHHYGSMNWLREIEALRITRSGKGNKRYFAIMDEEVLNRVG